MMNIIGRFDDLSIELEGTVDSLRELSQAIKSSVPLHEFLLVSPSISPKPYFAYAKSLRIERANGKVLISRIEDEIVIIGSLETLTIFVQNIDRLTEMQMPSGSGNYKDHIHIEYHPDHFYLKMGSIPLVITKSTHEIK